MNKFILLFFLINYTIEINRFKVKSQIKKKYYKVIQMMFKKMKADL